MTRLRPLLTIIAVLAMALAACGGGSTETTAASTETSTASETTAADTDSASTSTSPEEPGEPGKTTFSMTIGEEPPSLDSVTGTSAAMLRVLMFNVLETLVETDPETGEVVPGLAESWETSEDRLVYTFTIREGATFSDGQPVLASDVVFSLEARRSEDAAGARRNEMAPVDTIEAIDDRTVEVTLSTPSVRWLLQMARTGGMIFSEAHYDNIALEPIGSGPYMIDSWISGDRITLVPNPHWNGDGPYLERVDMLFIDDLSASINALLGGQIDAIWNLRGQRERIPELEGSGMTIDITPTQQLSPLMFNVQEEPFDDIRVRQAVAHAIDKQGVIDTFGGGYGSVVNTWVSPIDPWFDPDFDPYPYDPERSVELLAEAGYPDGLTFELSVIPNNPSGQIGEILALMLEPVGITVELNYMDVAVYLEQVTVEGKHIAGVVRSTTDLERFVGPMGWHTWWDNPEYDELVLGSDAAETFEEFVDMRRQAAEIFGNELPVLVISSDVSIAVYDDGITGWEYHAQDANQNDIRAVRWG